MTTSGSPGTLLTFFEWPRAEPGRLGRGTLESIGLGTPAVDGGAGGRGSGRAAPAAAARPSAARCVDVAVIGNPDLYAGLFDEDAPLRFGEPVEEPALIGAGTTHHIAWRVPDDAELQAWLERLTELGLRPTPVQDRKYFHSVYFRMPDGMLIEIATDGAGLPRRRAGRVARPGARAAAVARAGARDARARADPDRLTRGYTERALRRWWRNW